jgi:translocator protein
VILAVSFVVLVVLYAVLSQVWMNADPGWYAALPRPPWQPPDWVFGVVWPVNFLALGVVGAVLSLRDSGAAAPAFVVLAVSVACAVGWAYLFYAPHALGAAAVALGAAAVLTWALVAVAASGVWWTGLLLVPYAVWMSVATSLSAWYAAHV